MLPTSAGVLVSVNALEPQFIRAVGHTCPALICLGHLGVNTMRSKPSLAESLTLFLRSF